MNCMIIPFRYAIISEDACRGYVWRHKIVYFNTVIIFLSKRLCTPLRAQQDERRKYTSGIQRLGDVYSYKKKIQGSTRIDHLLLNHINLQLLFLKHFLLFGISLYYLNFNFVINGTCVEQIDYIIFTIYVVFYDGVRLFIRHTCAPCLGSNYSLMPSRCCRRCEAHFCHMWWL